MLITAILVTASAKVAVGVDSRGGLDLSLGSNDKDIIGTGLDAGDMEEIKDMDSTQLKEKVGVLLAELRQKNSLIDELSSALEKEKQTTEGMRNTMIADSKVSAGDMDDTVGLSQLKDKVGSVDTMEAMDTMDTMDTTDTTDTTDDCRGCLSRPPSPPPCPASPPRWMEGSSKCVTQAEVEGCDSKIDPNVDGRAISKAASCPSSAPPPAAKKEAPAAATAEATAEEKRAKCRKLGNHECHTDKLNCHKAEGNEYDAYQKQAGELCGGLVTQGRGKGSCHNKKITVGKYKDYPTCNPVNAGKSNKCPKPCLAND